MVEPLIRQTRELLPEKIRLEDGEEGWNYTVRNSILVVLEGLEEDLNALTDDMLDAWLSLEGLEEGENRVEVHVTAGTAFTLVNVGQATVTMEKIPESQTGPEPGAASSGAAEEEESTSSPPTTTAAGIPATTEEPEGTGEQETTDGRQ